jgi:hypothetical protein
VTPAPENGGERSPGIEMVLDEKNGAHWGWPIGNRSFSSYSRLERSVVGSFLTKP